jgi:hypothetical protein
MSTPAPPTPTPGDRLALARGWLSALALLLAAAAALTVAVALAARGCPEAPGACLAARLAVGRGPAAAHRDFAPALGPWTGPGVGP